MVLSLKVLTRLSPSPVLGGFPIWDLQETTPFLSLLESLMESSPVCGSIMGLLSQGFKCHTIKEGKHGDVKGTTVVKLLLLVTATPLHVRNHRKSFLLISKEALLKWLISCLRVFWCSRVRNEILRKKEENFFPCWQEKKIVHESLHLLE